MEYNEIKRVFTEFFVLFVLLLLLSGCSSMSQEEAEMKATSFVRENVKFYSKNGSDIDMIPSLNIVILESFKEGDYWNVIVDASSQVGNDTKDAQLKVVLNSKTGEIIRFLQVKST